ncbi:MAG TPA: GNAT family N-acetyltransferase [Candidatus Eisenbacteria bacterium]|nr:GNAT family N-acetyltransferase [Candidatus Eisenbacteria bacterium]
MDRNERGGAGRGVVRYVVYTWVPEEMLAEWNDWHNRVHIPRVLLAPQMKSVRKFRVRESTGDLRFRPQFVTVYELSSAADFEAYRTGPGIALKREYEERYGSVGKIARMLYAETPLEQVRRARIPEDLALVRSLLEEYGASLAFDLSFQDFKKELEGLPGEYAPPGGAILLACEGDLVLGCVALRPMGQGVCEMKRLFVRPGFRGRALGRGLAEAVIAEAVGKRYRKMRLDTVPAMTEAIALYRSLGFRPIEPYRANPIPGAMFFEKDLGT